MPQLYSVLFAYDWSLLCVWLPKPKNAGINIITLPRLMHKNVFMHLPAWRPPEAVPKQGSCG